MSSQNSYQLSKWKFCRLEWSLSFDNICLQKAYHILSRKATTLGMIISKGRSLQQIGIYLNNIVCSIDLL